MSSQSLRLPAEWEKQDQVIMSWFGAIRRDTVSARMIEGLQPHVPIILHIWDDSVRHDVNRRLSSYHIDTNLITYHIDPFAVYWTRDPILFVKDHDSTKVVSFHWTDYGIYPDLLPGPVPDGAYREQYDEDMAEYLKVPVIKSDYVFEGGGIESNGSGTLMIIKEMALQRNPNKTTEQIEEELKRTLGAKKIIWLKEGLIEDRQYKNLGPFYKNYFGGGANMHIDELCRFVNDSTVVLPYINPEEKNDNPVDSINYDMLEANFQILQAATTSEGKKISVIRIPMPEIEELIFTMTVDSSSYERLKIHGFEIGDTIYRVPAASYCNFFISNNVVLTQKYWKTGMSEQQKRKDEESYQVFQQLFPDRKIIPIFTHSINRGGGGIHCATHEVPRS